MNEPGAADLETDPRFPSGPWTGYFLQPEFPPGKHMMEMLLTFRNGQMTGEGRDWVGPFIIQGSYSVQDGKCHWTKKILDKHDVAYKGFNEGKGIWGVWEISGYGTGGFHIWPEGMPDPTGSHLTEEAALPIVTTEEPEDDRVAEPVSAGPRGGNDGPEVFLL
jgi:hypothetical protein